MKKKEVSQTFNLKELLGREPTEAEKSAFVEKAIQFIQDRTQGGRDINGDEFVEYSKKYAEEKGVSVGDVNMTLTGDMLSAIEKQNVRKNLVKVKIDDTTEAAKAYNHNIGDTLPRRPWFGLSKDDAKEIAQDIAPPREQEEEEDLPVEELRQLTVGELLQRLGGLEAGE